MNDETMPKTLQGSMPIEMLREGQDFSLVLGGPLFQLLRRSHLSGDALELLQQRILILSLFAWVPLLALSVLEGQALGGRAAVPFLLDVEVHVRFLVALPLLIVAELVVHRRMRFVVRQFLERNLIPASALPRFDAKWLRRGAPADEPFVGSGDIQSLADLANSFEFVKTMQIAPITRDALLRLVAATLAPVVPLLLTMMRWKNC